MANLEILIFWHIVSIIYFPSKSEEFLFAKRFAFKFFFHYLISSYLFLVVNVLTNELKVVNVKSWRSGFFAELIVLSFKIRSQRS